MKAWRNLLANTLARRFLVVFALTVVIPITAIGLLVARINGRILLRDASRRVEQTLEQLALAIDEEARRISLLAAALAYDPQFIASGLGYSRAAERADEYRWSQRMEQHLDDFFQYSNKIGAVLVFFRDKPTYVYRNSSFLFERGLPQEAWREEVMREKGRTRILPDLSSHSIRAVDRPVLSVAVGLDEKSCRQGLEALVVSFQVSYFDQILGGRIGDAGEALYLVNDAGEVLLSSRPAEQAPEGFAAWLSAGRKPPESGSVFQRRGGRRYLISSSLLPFASWRLVSAIDTRFITRSSDRVLAAARYSIAAFLLLFAVFIALFFRQIVRPVHQVIATMKRVEGGDYRVSVGETGLAELAELGRAFNAMVAQVHRLTREKEQKERERWRLEMAALRLTLNPHFLTNTLNSIRLMAAMSRAENIKEMTGALMRVLNDCFRDEDGTTTVAGELEVLESYLHIMKVRYGDRFDLRLEVEPSVRPLFILRMLLQPLVENSILHGVSGLDRKGEIRIRGYTEGGRLYLEVADNGRGMSREQIEEALAAERPEHHGLRRVGLHSVCSRIRLTHGEPHGLRIESAPGAGTRITLCLPVLESKGALDA